jgi:AsmA protein
MRRLVVGVGIMLALILVVAFVFAATFNVNHYRGAIQTQLEKRLGRSVSLGEMHVNLFPPRFRVENPAISDDSDFSADAPFIKAQQLDVAVKLSPLLRKEIEITSLDLLNPSVNLIRNSAGVWNFASLGHPVESQSIGQPPVGAPNQVRGKAAAQESDSSERPSKQQLSLAELTIHDGQISVVDQQKSKLPSVYDHIDATLKNLGPNSQFTLDASVHMAGSGTQEVRLRGQGGPIVNDQPETTPFRGTLGLKTIRLSDLSKFLNAPILAAPMESSLETFKLTISLES